MKRMICDGCGAPLKVLDSSCVNVQCEYCGYITRVVDEKAEQYNTVNIVNNIIELGTGRIRKDSFDNDYEHVFNLIENNKYLEASNALNKILEQDHTQSRAWYFKSLLPVLEQESIVYRGCYINILVLMQLTKSEDIKQYLTECGLPWYRHRGFMKFYGSTDFLFEQEIKFLDKAIQHASTPERTEFFKKRKTLATKRQIKKLRRRLYANFFLVLLLMAVMAGVIIFIGGVLLDDIKF